MKFATRFLCIILLFICIYPLPANAQSEVIINTSNSSKGYFTVKYTDNNPKKMKVGITYNNQTTYYDYKANEVWKYALINGDGDYTIGLYSHVSGNKYRRIMRKSVNVHLENDLSPFLISTWEIQFSRNDLVGRTAMDVCENLRTDYSKMLAIFGYVNRNISYDYAKADNIITPYIPKAIDTLMSRKGICYDVAVLFAAMCRSQGIPCTIEKEYFRTVYHAYNKVYVDDVWYTVDILNDICTKIKKY